MDIQLQNRISENRISLEKKLWDSKAKGYDKVVDKLFQKIYAVILENMVQ